VERAPHGNFKVRIVLDVELGAVGTCDDGFCVFSKDKGPEVDALYTQHGYSISKPFGDYDNPNEDDDNDEDDETAETTVVDELNDLLIPQGKGALITGAGGTGKTTQIIKMVDTVFPSPTLLTAMTGEAAEVLSESGVVATTLHRLLKIFHGDVENKRLNAVARRHEMADEPFNAATLVIDEVSMMSDEVFEFVLCVLKRIAPTCVVVLCADFAQLPPVPPEGETDCRYCFESPHFADFVGDRIYELTVNHRNTDPRWLMMINHHLRLNGTLTDDDMALLASMTPLHRPLTPEHVHIYPTRQMVKDHNLDMLDANPNRLITVEPTFLFSHKTRAATDYTRDATIHSSLKLPDKAQYTVSFKVDARIRLTHNINVADGLHNGAMGIVDAVRSDNKVVVKFDGRAGTQTFDPTDTVVASDTRYVGGGTAHRVQVMALPFKLAYAGTIHSTQGGTYDKLCIHFATDEEPHRCRIFARGQAYVALSRPRDPADVVVVNPESLPQEGLTDERVVDFYTRVVPAAREARRQPDQGVSFGNAPGFRLGPPRPSDMRTLLENVRSYYTRKNKPCPIYFVI